MTEVYNRETLQKEYINDQDELHNALASDTHALKKGTKVRVINPHDNEIYEIDSDKVKEAIKRGWTVETDASGYAREFKEKHPILGPAIVAGGQFVDEMAMGIPEMIADKTLDPHEVARKNAIKEEYEFINNAAGILGGVSSLAFGGPLWKTSAKAGEKATEYVAKKLAIQAGEEAATAGTKKVAKEIVARGAGAGVEGIIATSPIAVTEALLGDPEQAAETVLFSSIIGGAFGATPPLGKKLKELAQDNPLVDKAKAELEEIFSKNDKLKKLSGKFYFRSLKPNATDVDAAEKAIRHEIAAEADDIISKNMTPEDIGLRAKELGLMTKSAEERVQVANALREQKIGKISSLLDEADQKSLHSFDVGDIFNGTTARLEKKYDSGLDVEDHEWVRGQISKIMEVDAMIPPGFKQANVIKANLQRKAYDSKGYSKKRSKMLGEYAKDLNMSIKNTYKDIMGTQKASELLTEQTDLGILNANKNLFEREYKKESKNNFLSLTAANLGGAGMITGAYLYGGIGGAVIGTAAASAIRKWQQKHGDRVVGNALNGLNGLLHSEQAMKTSVLKLDKIPELMKRLESGKNRASRARSTNAIYRMMGEDKEPKTKKERVEALKKFEDKNLRWVGPSLIDEATQAATAISYGAPEIAQQVSSKLMNAKNYISKSMPRSILRKSVFAPGREADPSDVELKAFEDKLAIVKDPYDALKFLEAGNLNMNHVDALKNVYPRIYQEMKDRIIMEATENQYELAYKDRLNLSILFGAAIDPSVGRLSAYQSAYSLQEEEGGDDSSFKAGVDIATGAQTDLEAAGI